MRLILIVGTGSFIGGICRYLLSIFIQSNQLQFSLWNVDGNLIGCFLIGIIFGVFEKTQMSTEWRLLLVTGYSEVSLLFRHFSGETFNLIKNGHAGLALLYILVSNAAGISLTFFGAWIIKTTTPA
jgi:CrcB protein